MAVPLVTPRHDSPASRTARPISMSLTPTHRSTVPRPSRLVGRIGSLTLATSCVLGWAVLARADHQTDTVSVVYSGSRLPFRVELREFDFGATPMPSLHSFTVGEHAGKWVLIGGRTNGLHGFENTPSTNFPESEQNRNVWVIDPVAKQSWSRSLADLGSSGLSATQLAELTTTNNQFTQIGDRIYMAGGYGATASGGFDTFSQLSVFDLPGLVDWVQTGAGQAVDHLRQLSSETFAVTGGAMYEIDGRVHLVFGQDFEGGYRPGKNGVYTKSVRSFDIVDDGSTLAIANESSSPPNDAYRRRDLNVYPVLRPDGQGAADEQLVVLSGVFTETDGAWTVPVEIDAQGNPTMADPQAAGTFRQAINNYHSAKFGLYSAATGEMHEVLLGGITLQEYDAQSNTFVQDDNLPWTNQIGAVSIDASGEFSQSLAGAFPDIRDDNDNLLRFGANGEFLAADGVPLLKGSIIDLDALTGPTNIGMVFGGIFSNSPHVRGVPGAVSGASGLTFEVIVTPIDLLPGDYNTDGAVDALDYAVWRETLGQTGNLLAADGDADFDVDAQDYQIWRENYGGQLPAPASTAPEPASAALLLLLAACSMRCRSRG